MQQKQLKEESVYFRLTVPKGPLSIVVGKVWQWEREPGIQEADWAHLICTQEAEGQQEVEPGYKASKPTSTEVFHPARPHLLKVSYPSQTAPPPGDQIFKHVGL